MRSIVFSGFIFLLASCGGRLFVPVTFSPQKAGENIGVIENHELGLFIEHIDQTSRHFVYDLELVNKSNRPVLVDPHEVYYYGVTDPYDPLIAGEEVHVSFEQSADYARGVFALQEEDVNRDIRATIRARQVAGVVLMLAATAVVINDVVQDSKDYSRELWTSSDERRAVSRDIATFAGLVTIDMVQAGITMEQMKAYDDLEFLPDEYLHKSIVLPGESIRGRIFLPRRDVSHLRLVVPVEHIDYVFDFRQATGAEMRMIRQQKP